MFCCPGCGLSYVEGVAISISSSSYERVYTYYVKELAPVTAIPNMQYTPAVYRVDVKVSATDLGTGKYDMSTEVTYTLITDDAGNLLIPSTTRKTLCT